MISVIIPIYNGEKYIEKTLNGFLKQKTTFPVEYIIRDDASTDNTANILHEYERKYPGYFTDDRAGIFQYDDDHRCKPVRKTICRSGKRAGRAWK